MSDVNDLLLLFRYTKSISKWSRSYFTFICALQLSSLYNYMYFECAFSRKHVCNFIDLLYVEPVGVSVKYMYMHMYFNFFNLHVLMLSLSVWKRVLCVNFIDLLTCITVLC